MRALLLVMLAACGTQPVHAYRIRADVPEASKQVILATMAKINQELGCRALYEDKNSSFEIYMDENATEHQQLSSNSGYPIAGFFDGYTQQIGFTDYAKRHAVNRVGADVSANALMRVAAHEFGHALGKVDHSSEGYDLMFAADIAYFEPVSDEVWKDFVVEVKRDGQPCEVGL